MQFKTILFVTPALWQMDRRKDEIVLIKERRAGFIAGYGWRIERHIGEETLTDWDTSRQSEQAAGGRPHVFWRLHSAVRDAVNTSGMSDQLTIGQPAALLRISLNVSANAGQSSAQAAGGRNSASVSVGLVAATR